MLTVILYAAALGAPPAPPAALAAREPPVETEKVDVAYRELARHDNSAAVASILAGSAAAAGDPAALINLGTAYMRMGDAASARRAFNAAIASRVRYDLQLADGTWLDSRDAARAALAYLDRGRIVAAQ